MNDDTLRQAYARHVAGRAPDRRDSCPSPEALLAVVERTGPEPDRLATLDHAMSCASCGRELELLRVAAAAGEGSAARTRRFIQGPARFAAAAAILVAFATIATVTLRRNDGSILRGGDIALVSPVGIVVQVPVLLTWRRSPDATIYEVEVLSPAGDSAFAAVTRDTSLVLPAAATTAAGEYVWLVRARLTDGGQATSAPRRFTLRQP
jgi:hypothetical protein